MKKILARKLIIEMNDKGDFVRGVVAYYTDENGVSDKRRMKTLSITSTIDLQKLQAVLDGCVGNAKTAEGIIEKED